MDKFHFLPLNRGVQERDYFPVEKNPLPVSFTFVEVGCKSYGKRAQLKKKRDYALSYWIHERVNRNIVDWVPQIYRVLSTFHDEATLRPDDPLATDLLIKHEWIPKDYVQWIASSYVDDICDLVKKEHNKDLLREKFYNTDSDGLFNLVKNNISDDLGNARGKIAELVTQRSIDLAIDETVGKYDNLFVDLHQIDLYQEGTDQIRNSYSFRMSLLLLHP